MAEKQDLYYESRDGKTRIHGVIWKPDCMLGEQPAKPKCVLQIVHGMEEYIDRYDEFARFLNKYDICVIGNDHLGHGQSVSDEVVHGYFGMDDIATVVVRDVHRLKKMVQETLPEVPFFIMGHSMGSFLVRQYLCCHGTELSGAVICGTGYQPEAVLKAALALCRVEAALRGWKSRSHLLQWMTFGSFNSKFAPNRTQSDWLCRNEEIVDAYESDPKCGFLFTLNGYYNLFLTMYKVIRREYLERMPRELPVLFISGEKDPVGGFGKGVRTVEKLFRETGMRSVECRLYPEDRHELLNEVDRQEVYEDILDWIKQNGLL